MGILIFIIVGAIAGFVASKVISGKGMGLLWDIIAGILGAFLGAVAGRRDHRRHGAAGRIRPVLLSEPAGPGTIRFRPTPGVIGPSGELSGEIGKSQDLPEFGGWPWSGRHEYVMALDDAGR